MLTLQLPWVTKTYMYNVISPGNIQKSSRQVMRTKKKYQEGDYPLIQYQALWTEIIGIVWQIVRRITNEIMEVEGLSKLFNHK